MANALQAAVDQLAAALRRTVVLEDTNSTVVVNSRAYGDSDDALVQTLVDRAPTAEVLKYRSSLHLGAHTSPGMVERRPELGMQYDRSCTPLRSGPILIGYLWVTLKEPLSDVDADVLRDSGELLARLLDNMNSSAEGWNGDVVSATFALLDAEEPNRLEAAASLKDAGMFQRSSFFVAICLHVGVELAPLRGPAPHRLLYYMLNRAISAPAFDSYTFAVTLPSTFLVMGYRARPDRAVLDWLVRSILRELRANEPVLGEAARIGVGSPVERLEDCWLSFDQALTVVERGAEVAFWGDEPIQEALTALTRIDPSDHLIPQMLHDLAALPQDTRELVETYLKNAGDVAKTASMLGIHRGTVYYRINRLREALKIDFGDGEVRLAVHAWLYTLRHRGDVGAHLAQPLRIPGATPVLLPGAEFPRST